MEPSYQEKWEAPEWDALTDISFLLYLRPQPIVFPIYTSIALYADDSMVQEVSTIKQQWRNSMQYCSHSLILWLDELQKSLIWSQHCNASQTCPRSNCWNANALVSTADSLWVKLFMSHWQNLATHLYLSLTSMQSVFTVCCREPPLKKEILMFLHSRPRVGHSHVSKTWTALCYWKQFPLSAKVIGQDTCLLS